MKLVDALSLGKECGLHKVSECVFNVELHALNIFSYIEMFNELKELHDDVEKYKNEGWLTDTFDTDVALERLRGECSA